MRTQQRSFVVEIKSKRKSKQRPKSIWGNIDLGAYADGQALGNVAPVAAPPHEKTTPAPVNSMENAACSGVIAAPSDVVSSTTDVLPPVDVVSDLQEEPATARQSLPRLAKAKVAMRSRRVDSGNDDDDLAALSFENTKLKRLLAEKLSNENDAMRRMLARFL
jgi:hypothetical protein